MAEENLAIFSCETFQDVDEAKVFQVCFSYVTSSVAGTTYSTAELCLPTTMRGKFFCSPSPPLGPPFETETNAISNLHFIQIGVT